MTNHYNGTREGIPFNGIYTTTLARNGDKYSTSLSDTTPGMKKNHLATLALSLTLAILGVLAYKLAPSPPEAVTQLAPLFCNPGLRPCASPLPGGGQLELSLTPQPIRPLQMQDIVLTLRGLDAERVEIDFKGTEMDMGNNHALLSFRDGRFSGQVMLPVCITGSMTWAATVRISSKQGRLAVPFHFEVAGR
jgi:hypothetical protein